MQGRRDAVILFHIELVDTFLYNYREMMRVSNYLIPNPEIGDEWHSEHPDDIEFLWRDGREDAHSVLPFNVRTVVSVV